MARVKEHGERTVREALEYVANQFRECPHTITAKDDQKRPIGGPLLWSKINDIVEARRACQELASGRVGFLA